jgi:FAS-associated factor 2
MKYMLCVLVSPDHDDTQTFCTRVLFSPELIELINSRGIVVWIGSVRDAESFEISQTIGVPGYPFMALFAPTSSKLTLVQTFVGYVEVQQVIDTVVRVQLQAQTLVEAQRRERSERESGRTIRQMQDEAYQASLRADREKVGCFNSGSQSQRGTGRTRATRKRRRENQAGEGQEAAGWIRVT